ncbi:peroxiredoxin-like family protein [Novosphingobium sp. JCM 18896]|uniref:peroxiredoxin-like family protein n=1 Tax=Novosphingobium sp. JCM 18896 TaxID=2989731 RepID=UPI002223BB0B|nr:peroxiredoxin-like family protein [Novosphingobium sp. JCM 18896]MCW1430656.1 AhpC/TSA family protein [Novosphingobium sp. JCM 18896]
MKLPEKLAEFRRNFEAGGPPYNAPAHIHPPMHRATAELIVSGAADKALKVGDRAPTFALNDPEGNPVSSADLLAQGPLVVTFYRGVWCPYCNMDLQALQEALPKIRGLGADLVAISPQTAPNSRRSQRENHLDFPILSDKGNEVADAFQLRFELPDYLQELYKTVFSNDLAVANGEPSWTLPMPARYVIGQDGVIHYAEVNPDYTTRPDPEELYPVLEKLAKVRA